MDEKKIKQLMKLLKQSDLSELTVEEDGVRITVRRGPLTIVESKGEVLAGSGVSSEPGAVSSRQASRKKQGKAHREVTSPMVGTFYRAASPDGEPFVDEGDAVEKGQTVCIVEAMKLMNEIAIEEKGKIVKVVAENGQPVQYGDTLFLYEPVV